MGLRWDVTRISNVEFLDVPLNGAEPTPTQASNAARIETMVWLTLAIGIGTGPRGRWIRW